MLCAVDVGTIAAVARKMDGRIVNAVPPVAVPIRSWQNRPR